MKLAYPVTTPEVSGDYMAFTGSFAENIRVIKSIGYDALELLVCDPAGMNLSALQTLIRQQKLQVAAIGTGPAVAQDGLTLLDPDPQVRERAVLRLLDLVDLASLWGAVLAIGKYRGQLWQGREEEAWQVLAQALVRIDGAAAVGGVTVVIEPQSPFVLNSFHTTAETVGWLDCQGIAGTGILYDFCHGDIAEDTVASGILHAGERLRFVHCSDNDRLVPGTGHIHLQEAFDALHTIGYDGFVSMEICQQPEAATAARLAYQQISLFIRS